uniref:Uncharacterized protein n=1 Tax=Octactis speculum TaxID=3111310 RepID=A0A7S2B4A6_9STRA
MLDIIIEADGEPTKGMGSELFHAKFLSSKKDRVVIFKVVPANLKAKKALHARHAADLDNPWMSRWASLAVMTITAQMLLFPLYLFASVLIIAYNVSDAWSVLVTGAALMFLFELEDVLFRHTVSEGEKIIMKKDFSGDHHTSHFPELKQHVEVSAQMLKLINKSHNKDFYKYKRYCQTVTHAQKQLSNHIKDWLYREEESLSRDTMDLASRVRRMQSLSFPRHKLGARAMSFTFSPKMEFLERHNSGALADVNVFGEHASPAPPMNVYVFTAWRCTQGTIKSVLCYKLLTCTVLQFAVAVEIIVDYGSFDRVCEDRSYGEWTSEDTVSGPAAVVATIMVITLICARKVCRCLQALNLMAWPSHYKDFTHDSIWHAQLFSKKHTSDGNGRSVLATIGSCAVWFSMILSEVHIVCFLCLSMMIVVLVVKFTCGT